MEISGDLLSSSLAGGGGGSVNLMRTPSTLLQKRLAGGEMLRGDNHQLRPKAIRRTNAHCVCVVCVFVCVCACVRVCACACARARACVYVRACMRACACVCVNTCHILHFYMTWPSQLTCESTMARLSLENCQKVSVLVTISSTIHHTIRPTPSMGAMTLGGGAEDGV